MSDMQCRKKALITGITGQDGSYLTEFLLKKNYEVHGIIRRSSSFNTGRLDHVYQDPHSDTTRLFLHYGDLTDSSNLFEIVTAVKPDEVSPHIAVALHIANLAQIYNLGAMSHVKVSFEMSEYTAEVDGMLIFCRRFAATLTPCRHGHTSLAQRRSLCWLGEDVPPLPGFDLRAIRQGTGYSAVRNHALLSALAVRRRKAVRLLDDHQLPRGVRHALDQRHSFQPRIAAPR